MVYVKVPLSLGLAVGERMSQVACVTLACYGHGVWVCVCVASTQELMFHSSPVNKWSVLFYIIENMARSISFWLLFAATIERTTKRIIPKMFLNCNEQCSRRAIHIMYHRVRARLFVLIESSICVE